MTDDKYTCARDGCDAKLFDFCPEHMTPDPVPEQLPPNPCPRCGLEMGGRGYCTVRCRDGARGERTVADMVNKPPHYDLGIEPIEVIEAWGLGFCLGNAVKYIARAEHKGTLLQDLQKARWYLDREIEYRSAEPTGFRCPQSGALCINDSCRGSVCAGPPDCGVFLGQEAGRVCRQPKGHAGDCGPSVLERCTYPKCNQHRELARDFCTDCLVGRTPEHRTRVF